MTTKYIAKYDGHTFKRSSKSRTYTHAVISVINIEDARDEVKKAAARMFRINLPYNMEILAGGGHLAPYSEEALQRTRELVEAGPEGESERAGKQFDERLKNMYLSSDGKSYYTEPSWAGRLDLAQKSAKLGDIILVAEVVK